MSRLNLPRFALRRRLRRQSRGTQTTTRSLVLEQLDSRIVLTGISEAICLDAAAEVTTSVQPGVPEASAPVVSEASAAVYLADDGVLHVQPTPDVTNIVVRQYVDYHLQEVIEVEVAGQWTAFSVEQVAEIQVHQVSSDQLLSSAGVTVPIQVIEPAVIDAAFASSSTDLLPSQTLTLPSTSTPPPPSTPVSGPPSGTSTTPPIAPPVISNFYAVESDGYWQIGGSVTDDQSVAGLTITFGGLLTGHTASVNSQGIFSLTVLFPPGTNGGITAITTDTDGLQSNSAFAWVAN